MSAAGRRRGQPWFGLAALCLLAYICNVAARVALARFGVSLWHVGDVGEFVLVLASMSFFVGGVLAVAKHAPDKSER
ncbi:MAG: hypothetical protein ACM3QY_08965 [Candidatus Levyibacteriota bacterium]